MICIDLKLEIEQFFPTLMGLLLNKIKEHRRHSVEEILLVSCLSQCGLLVIF